MMKDISIKPIFVQNPKIWRDFAFVETRANGSGYFYNLYTNIPNLIRGHENDWTRADRYHIAFGAYKNSDLIGFAKAFMLYDNNVFLDSLYIDYEYHHYGIGSRLLKNIENATSLVAGFVGCYPAASAFEFYRKFGYRDGEAGLSKKETNLPLYKVAPLFQFSKDVKFKFNFDVDYDELVPFRNCPKFAYLAPDGKIDAVAINTNGKDVNYWYAQDQDAHTISNYKKVLSSALSKQR